MKMMRKKVRDDELEYIESEPAGKLPPLSAQHLSYTHSSHSQSLINVHCSSALERYIHIHTALEIYTHSLLGALQRCIGFSYAQCSTAVERYTHTHSLL